MAALHGHQRGIIMFFTILLILMLIFMAIVLKNSDAEKEWPPVISECPDYWYDSYYDVNVGSGDDDSDTGAGASCPTDTLTRQINDSSSYSGSGGGSTEVGTCYNVKNLGDPSCPKSMDFSQAPWTGTDGLCNKYNWAMKCDMTWDGITDQSNPCIPDASSDNGDTS